MRSQSKTERGRTEEGEVIKLHVDLRLLLCVPLAEGLCVTRYEPREYDVLAALVPENMP